MLDITSDGRGGWTEAQVNPDNGTRPQVEQDNPFAGISDVASADDFPKEFASAFSKYDTLEIEGVTYHFKEMSVEETIIYGENPLLAMAKDLDEDMLNNEGIGLDFATEVLNSEDAIIHMSKVILNNLIELRVGDSVMQATPKVVWQLRRGVKLALYNAILGLNPREVPTVNRFPAEPADESEVAS